MRSAFLLVLALGAISACGDSEESGATLYFDLDGNITERKTFFDFPFPSDLRLTAEGGPDLTGFPNPKDIVIVEDLVSAAADRKGFSTNPIGYFRFSEELAPRVQTDPIPAATDSPVLLVDVDPDSPNRGKLIPTVALTLVIDDYMPGYGLAVAPRPGFVLEGERTYAFVVMRSLGDVEGNPLGVASAIGDLARGKVPDGAWGQDAADLYAPLWPTLEELGVDPEEVAAATVFTTADVVQDLYDLSTALLGEYSVTIDNLVVDPDDGADHDRFCELVGTVSYPQFQRGRPPFNSEGLFEIGEDGLPVLQRYEEAPMVITIPSQEMPADGYPLMIYFHGSGGYSSQVVDRGPVTEVGGSWTKGEGPAYVVAPFGIASAGSALPVNPERVPNASETEYLNVNNLPAFRDTFRQGVIEQRLFLEALRTLEISPDLIAACTGPSLPAGATSYHFDPDKLIALGQSMGGMYTNLISAVEPRIRASVPTGAGGFWGYYILHSTILPGTRELLAVMLGTPYEDLTFMHPGMQLLDMAWETAEPLVFMPRLARRPLEGHPVRPIYEPVGKGDEYFPTVIYDAVALAYGHQEAGEEIWPSMQDALALEGLDGIISYPVSQNLESADGTPYTGVVVQYEGDGIDDPHVIFVQLDDVKYQYGCFLSTFLERGVATVPAPAALGTPCP